MTKVNPATKAAEAAEEEEDEEDVTVEEMLEKYEEVKESTSQTVKKKDAVNRLPQGVLVEDGTLVQPDDQSEGKMTFTEARRDVLKARAKNPDMNNYELADMIGRSQSHVSRTQKYWGFLLEDPYLYESFVLGGRTSDSGWTLETENGETLHPGSRQKALTQMKKLWVEEDTESKVVSPDGEVCTLFNLLDIGKTREFNLEDAEESDEGEEPERQEETGHIPHDMKDEAESDEEEPLQEAEVVLSPEQVSKVLNGLYRDKEAETAVEIVSQLIDQ